MTEGTAEGQTKSPPPTRAEQEEALKSHGTPMRRRRIELGELETKEGIENYMHDTGIKSWGKVVDMLYELETYMAAWVLTVIHSVDEEDLNLRSDPVHHCWARRLGEAIRATLVASAALERPSASRVSHMRTCKGPSALPLSHARPLPIHATLVARPALQRPSATPLSHERPLKGRPRRT